MIVLCNFKVAQPPAKRIAQLATYGEGKVPWAAQQIYKKPVVSCISSARTEDRQVYQQTMQLDTEELRGQARQFWSVHNKSEKAEKKQKQVNPELQAKASDGDIALA